MSADGTSNLTPEEQDVYLERFGERYVTVQWHPGAASRKERRERQFRPKLHALRIAEGETNGTATRHARTQGGTK